MKKGDIDEIIQFSKEVIDLFKYIEITTDRYNLYKRNDEGEKFDGYFPNGILEYNIPVMLEIKANLKHSNQFIKRFNDKYDDDAHLILVLFQGTSSKKEFKNTTILSKAEVNKLARKYSYMPFINYYDGRYNYEYKKSSVQISKLLKDTIEKKEDKLTFVFGAGVSVDYKLPQWNNLLENMFKDTRSIANHEEIIKKVGNSNLIKARVLFDFYREELKITSKEIAAKLKNNLYLNADLSPLKSTIKSFADFLLRSDTKPDIITYNYDNLIELEIGSLLDYQIIYQDMKLSSNKTTIYHPHGYIPYDKELTQSMVDSVILTENNYNFLFNNPYSWANIMQINKFRETICIFIGSSLQDPSIRRLLELSVNKENTKYHYAFVHTDGLNHKEQELTQNHYSGLGVNIIWYDNHEFLIEFFDKLF